VRRIAPFACLVLLLGRTAALPAPLRDHLPEAARRVGIEGGAAFDALADAIADTAARTLPVLSASAGFTYRYNPVLEVFERSSDTLGPLFVERPDTLGRGRINASLSFQYVQLDRLDGRRTRALEAPDPIVLRVVAAGGTPVGFTANRLRYNLRLMNHIVGVSLTYGLLDALDLNLLVPVVVTDFDVTATSRQLAVAGLDGAFVPQPEAPRAAGVEGTSAGLGDLLLRTKYQLPRAGGLRSALGLQLRLPSGDREDLRGTGSFEASPFLALSTLLSERVEPHAMLAVDLRAEDVDRSQGRYALGVDVDVTRRLGVALAFLGRSEFGRVADPGETSFLHLTDAGPVLRPLLGIEFDRKDYFDFAFGLRFVFWRDVMLFANAIHALNDDGLRSADLVPTFGVEGTF
jgi:hypothetical protein